jgi:predicted MFS family arabinose efflux permease
MSSILDSKRDQYILAFASLFLMAGVMGTRPLVPLLANQYGAGVGHIGVIVSLFSFLPLLLAIKMGVWIDHHGTKKPLFISSLLCSTSFLLLFFIPSLAGLYLSQVLAGFSQTLFVLAAQTFVGNTSQPSQRIKNVATFSLGAGTGSFVGPIMGGFSSDVIGYTNSFLVLGVFSMIAALIIGFIKESQQGVQSVGPHDAFNKEATYLLMRNRDLRKVFLISSLVLLAKDMYVAYFPLLANSSGLSGSMIGIIVSMHTIAGVLIRWYLPQLTERFGKSEVIVASI